MKKQTTYCNPVPFPEYPQGRDELYLGFRDTDRDYVSLSDPDGFYLDGTYYLYTSYYAAYTSKDLMHWERHYLDGPENSYAPAVLHYRDKFYYINNSKPLYVSDQPFGPFTKLGMMRLPNGEELPVADPDFFLDDDGRVYLIWGCGPAGIIGAELNPDDLTQMITEPKTLVLFNPDNIWERWGEYNQDKKIGWTEGGCLEKINGRYYLYYAACGTTYSTYASGVYVSDVSPLEGYVYQKNNPVTAKNTGFVRGGGHGCIIPDDKGNVWAFYTCPVSYSHRFERMIGMDPVFVKDGELVSRLTDQPTNLDGSPREDLLPLTVLSLAKASSCAPGREAVYAADESMLSFWMPAKDDKEPVLEISLRGEYKVGAGRVLCRNLNLDYTNGITPPPLRYRMQIKDLDGNWITVVDAWDTDDVMTVDYHEFDTVVGTDARICLRPTENQVEQGIISFMVFGERA